MTKNPECVATTAPTCQDLLQIQCRPEIHLIFLSQPQPQASPEHLSLERKNEGPLFVSLLFIYLAPFPEMLCLPQMLWEVFARQVVPRNSQ